LPVAATFEVVSVKRVTDPSVQLGARTMGGGRLSAVLTVRALVSLAYGYPDTLRDAQIVGGPSWMSTDRFEINATFEGPVAVVSHDHRFLDNIATYERMGNHMRWAAAKRTLTELEGQPKESWRIRDHAIVFYSLFPNTVLTYTQDHCGVFTSFPIGPEEAVLHFSVLVSPEERAKKPDSYWEANRNLFASALVEDLGIGETIQRNCHTGANRQQTFGKFEKALGWYHAEIDRAVA